MQATIDTTALKQLTRALTCLTKYGDDLILRAMPDHLSLHTTNSSATAYCHFVYKSHFFSRYRLKSNGGLGDDEDVVEERPVEGQLSTKSLLAILKHRTVDKTVESCELSIVDGDTHDPSRDLDEDDEERDSLESKLIVRLHCKHGVIKTHKLLLSESSRHMAPNIPDGLQQSHLSINPKAISDTIEHFTTAKSVKYDTQLIWCFGDDEVQVRSQEGSIDSKGKAQLATELTMVADEFQVYDIYSPPITIAFHLREFSAAIAFAEASNVCIDLRFTEPADPLFMLTDNGDSYETLFVISMCQVTQLVPPNRISQQQARQPHFQPQGKKRGLEEDEESISRHSSTPQEPTPANNAGGNVNGRTPGSVVRKKPLKAAVRTERSLNSPLTERSRSSPWSHRGTPMFGNGSMPPPSAVPAWALDQNPRTPQRSQRSHLAGEAEAGPSRDQMKEPLFLPSSQLSQVDKQALKESGLGIENMNREEFMAMLDDEGEEVRVFPRDLHVEGDISMDVREDGEAQGGGEVEIDGRLPEWDELEKFDETGEHETQYEYSQGLGEDKTFKPLFDD